MNHGGPTPVQPGGARPVGPFPAAGAPDRRAPAGGSAAAGEFASVFDRARETLHVSAHAAERLRAAGAGSDTIRIAAAAVGRAAAKGSRNTLVMMQGLALVVSVPNRTVVTAVEASRMGDHVFTGIDSAVIA